MTLATSATLTLNQIHIEAYVLLVQHAHSNDSDIRAYKQGLTNYKFCFRYCY